MTFQEVIKSWPLDRIRGLYEGVTPERIETALAREHRDVYDLIALFSPEAQPFLERMAQEAHRITRRQFGSTISLYAPIYLSNVCAANCVYCGFSANDNVSGKRVTLDEQAIESECEALARMGYRSVLLLTGDAPLVASPHYIGRACAIARRWFASVAVEVYSMDEQEYALLCRNGLDGVTLYMETYDEPTYVSLHHRGRKKDYKYRLGALDRASRAGVRRLSAGILLGLFDWRLDAVWLALHVSWLQKHCWQSAISISFPRLRHVPGGFEIPCSVTDADLAQILTAMRLVFPDVGFNLSTREPAGLRDRLVHLGVTSMSAGSSTRPGGYACPEEQNLPQFEVEDRRTPAQVVEMISKAGYDPVWKDFDQAFFDLET
jgi:2-iminoacetate synthase